MEDLLESIENVKEKLTSAEYKEIMNHMMIINNKSNPPLDDHFAQIQQNTILQLVGEKRILQKQLKNNDFWLHIISIVGVSIQVSIQFLRLYYDI